ncbi:spore coat protein GerQ [Neobacillus drentensis]|uniref:spore coat protein GerQ n=1 Tax=Neobacillus drentensis TaxID=220684 RepID=UPI002FFED651
MNQYYNPQGFQPYPGDAGQQQRTQGMPGAGQSFYPAPGAQGFPQSPPAYAGSAAGAPAGMAPGQLPIEQSYIENILRLNKGKLCTVFATFEGNNKWNAKEFTGIIEAAGRDHVILSDPQVGTRWLIPMVAVDYIQFPEAIEYEYPYGSSLPATYPPR